jgi:hydrogenase nickel incorporation protein HypA/HybF
MPLQYGLHEMSIARAIMDAVQTEAGLHQGAHLTRVGLRIGELSGVEPESLRFCLETLVSGTVLDPLAFEFELCPWTRRCRLCGADFRVAEYNPACPSCGSADTEAAGGDQLELSYLEVEGP